MSQVRVTCDVMSQVRVTSCHRCEFVSVVHRYRMSHCTGTIETKYLIADKERNDDDDDDDDEQGQEENENKKTTNK